MFGGPLARRSRIQRAAFAATSSAGRAAAFIRRRTRQSAPLKARLATVAKPASSERSARSRWAIRSPVGRSRSVTRTHQQSTRRLRRPRPARTSSAGRADHRGAQGAALGDQAGAGVQVPGVVAHEVAEQAHRDVLGPLVAGPRALGQQDVGPALGVERRDDPRVREAHGGDGEGEGRDQHEQRRGRHERDDVRGGVGGPQLLAAAQARRRDPRAPVDVRDLGKCGCVSPH